MEKNKKVLLPIAIVLAILIALMLILTITVKVVGSRTSKASGEAVSESTQKGEQSDASTDYLSGYGLDDYSVSSGITLQESETEEEAVPEDGTALDAMSDPDAYLLPDSNTISISETDLEGMTAQELCYAANEISARYGKIFESMELNEYFGGKNWYVPDNAYDDSCLGETELTNIAFILQYQADNGLEYTPN